ncbi:Forkhead box N4 [Paramuricea clavata]|uniref:Forkhead box N4 n=1 Tax=Paramuricea clavata TaxID=317549 RepID=A0A7D9DPE5_PARCT|nr:Forkhead box N4 [Paramuricea clavata]
MDIYQNYTHPFQHGGDISIHDLVDCDIKELDINYNDPSFEVGQYTDAAFHQQLVKSDKFHGSLPADLTNLQWLQNMNVAIPVDQNPAMSQHSVNVMVDPNTAMPVQNNMNGWGHQNPVQVQPIHPQHLVQRRAIDKPKKTNIPISAKDDKNHKEKTYPKPVFSYSCLIAMALQDSDAGTLPVSEIYKFMQSNFPYFKTAPDGWKNSVRHNLSLNKAFCKLERPQGTSQRKGCLWTLKPEKKEQMFKEIKKWKKKHADSIKASMARPDEFHISNDDMDSKYCPKAPPKDHNDHCAAADAAKDLFGNGIMEEMHSEAFWDDIMSSSSPDSLKYVDPTFVTSIAVGHPETGYPNEVSTTVEVDSSAHYYGNEFDNHISNVGNVYSYSNGNIYPQTVGY